MREIASHPLPHDAAIRRNQPGDAGGEARAALLDAAITVGIAAAYLLASVVLLPAREWPRAVGGALAIFALIAAAALWMGRGRVSGISMLGVSFAAAAVLLMPTFPGMGGTGSTATVLGFAGSQAAAILWAALRWEPRPHARSVTLRRAWAHGLGAAAALSVVATIPLALALLADDESPAILLVYPGYVAGFLGAATLYWLLQRMLHLATGQYLVGALGGACVYAAFIPLQPLFGGEQLEPGLMLVLAFAIGAMVGPATAFQLAHK